MKWDHRLFSLIASRTFLAVYNGIRKQIQYRTFVAVYNGIRKFNIELRNVVYTLFGQYLI